MRKRTLNRLFVHGKKKVVQLLEEQTNRSVLWVFDYDGNTGKTELGKFLMFKKNYQVLVPGRTHDICGILNPFANGYVFDCARNAFSSSGIQRINEMFGVLEDIKNNYLVSGKYRGLAKIITSHKIVVFANQLPNLDKLSLDRWHFSYTTWVGRCIKSLQVLLIYFLLKTSFLISVTRAVGVHCTGEDLYTCKIDRENQST